MKSLRKAALMAALVCATMAACTSGTTADKTTPTAAQSSHGVGLPSFPSNIPGNVLLRIKGDGGTHALVTQAPTSKSITVELACAGKDSATAAADIYQGPGKPIFRISGQQCLGDIHQVSLTASSLAPLRISVAVPSGGTYALLVTSALS